MGGDGGLETGFVCALPAELCSLLLLVDRGWER